MKELPLRSSISFFSKEQLCDFLEIKEEKLSDYLGKVVSNNGQYKIEDLTNLRKGYYTIRRLS